jgi:hypothetical protein
MQIRGDTQSGHTITLSRSELDILQNCLNETANGIAIPEFETRLGATIEDVRQLLELLAQADWCGFLMRVAGMMFWTSEGFWATMWPRRRFEP